MFSFVSVIYDIQRYFSCLDRVRHTIVKALVPSPADVVIGSSSPANISQEVGKLLQINPRNREYRRAVQTSAVIASGQTSTADIQLLLLPPVRKKRSDALDKSMIYTIERAWRECSEESPNSKDVIRYELEDGTKVSHPAYSCYQRTIDIVEYLKRTFDVSLSLSVVSMHKPFYIRKGKVDTCMCHKCENIRLLKVAVTQSGRLINLPTAHVRALHILTTWTRTVLMAMRIRRTTSLRMPGRVLHEVCRFMVREIWYFALIFPTLSLVDVCTGAYKSEILDRVLCRRALPQWQQFCESDCGRQKCYGECDESGLCRHCTGGKFRRMLTSNNINIRLSSASKAKRIATKLLGAAQTAAYATAVTQAASNTIKYRSWGSTDGTATTAELLNRAATVNELIAYATDRFTCYALHVATLRRQKRKVPRATWS